MDDRQEEIVEATLESLQEEVDGLKLINSLLTNSLQVFRDEVALSVFAAVISREFTGRTAIKDAAIEAYEAADIFIRVKEDGNKNEE